METTLPLPFLISPALALNLGHVPSSNTENAPTVAGLSPAEIRCLGCVFYTVTPENFQSVAALLKLHGVDLHVYLDVSRVENQDDVRLLLNLGARMVFVKASSLLAYVDIESRVGLVISATNARELDAALITATSGVSSVHGLLVTGVSQGRVVELGRFLEHDIQQKVPKREKFLVSPADGEALLPFVEAVKSLKSVLPVLPSSGLTTSYKPLLDAALLSVAKILTIVWISDRPDELIPTVVCDLKGIALGLVYSSEESVAEALRTQTGVYQSRKRGLWYKGATSGDTQELVRISLDCDNDALRFVVRQKGCFCHLEQSGCFGQHTGLAQLEQTLLSRRSSAPPGSYTARLFADARLLRAKIMEEAEELCDAATPEDVAFEAADLMYFALTKAVATGVTLADIERNLDAKSHIINRRLGNAKGKWAKKEGIVNNNDHTSAPSTTVAVTTPPATLAIEAVVGKRQAAAPEQAPLKMKRYDLHQVGRDELNAALRRPSQKSAETIMDIVKPIIRDIRQNGDKSLLSYTHKFEKATSLTSPVLKAPFPEHLMQLLPETRKAIDVSFENVRKFHAAQREEKPLRVETMPGVVCSRFTRPIQAVGLYVPGGTAVLPSTAMMLGVPAMVAGCKKVVIASPPRSDGSVTPEIVYVAHKVGAESIVLAGGAQAVAAMAYGTESVGKVDKILGPGNQFVTAAKMYVSNDSEAAVSIDMPAGPSEVLVIADQYANPAFVASDLLSQAEHGVDSQVVLIAVDLDDAHLRAIEDELHRQAMALPRVDIVCGSIDHSITVQVKTVDEAMEISNSYAPEHLILQFNGAEKAVDQVINAGSVFIGPWTPESVGDYSAGVNHSLPTSGYAKQCSGVSLASFVKHITSTHLTAEGLRNISEAVMQLSKVEELEAHRRAVSIRMDQMNRHMEAN